MTDRDRSASVVPTLGLAEPGKAQAKPEGAPAVALLQPRSQM